ncbi:MAG: L-aspartate oxidase [Elusimicrobiota bacterium]
MFDSDFLVIGSGLAGLMTAHKLSSIGFVNVVTKRYAIESNTRMAQGGIAAVMKKPDSFQSHIKDTLNTGAGLSNPEIVEMTIKEAPDRIRELMALGVQFTRKGGFFELGLEGGHSNRRILHVKDYTGEQIEKTMVTMCRTNPKIRFFENHAAVDLILQNHPSKTMPEKNTCFGAYVLEEKTGLIHNFTAGKTIIATGGAGKVYLYTSNPDIATGDGMAMAYRAGLKLVNMEFVQFHPTCLFHPKAKSFLISEALRGEGGILRLQDGTPFMSKYAREKELAPRDIVARSIDFEMKKTGAECVYLDMTHLKGDFLKKRFPSIYTNCLSFGIDITREPIPVVPAAHFFCGGIEVDSFSKTAIKNLYAVGEVSCTGLHGANRLASNSLLEACVFAHRLVMSIKDDFIRTEIQKAAKSQVWNYGNAVPSDEAVVISNNWDEIRSTMWNYVGIVRSNRRIERAKTRMKIISEEILKYYWDYLLTRDLLELRNIACISEQIMRSAELRKESRGLHYNIDYPRTLSEYSKNTYVDRYSN